MPDLLPLGPAPSTLVRVRAIPFRAGRRTCDLCGKSALWRVETRHRMKLCAGHTAAALEVIATVVRNGEGHEATP